METLGEIIPFAKEMLDQRPSRGMLKIYILGSTLAMVGVIGGLLETVFLPFVEDGSGELLMEEEEEEKKKGLELHTSLVQPEPVEMCQTAVIETKVKSLMTVGQRSSANRLHAS